MNKKLIVFAIFLLLFGSTISIVNLPAEIITKFEENAQVITTDTLIKNSLSSSLDLYNSKCNQFLKEKRDIIWTSEDEGDHFPCGCEYWWLYTMLTLDDGRQLDFCAQFFYKMNWTGNQWRGYTVRNLYIIWNSGAFSEFWRSRCSGGTFSISHSG